MLTRRTKKKGSDTVDKDVLEEENELGLYIFFFLFSDVGEIGLA